MMPVVSVRSRPNGLPMANTRWPTCRLLELPKTAGTNRAAGASTLSTATSVAGSKPTNLPLCDEPSNKSTWISRAPSTTW